MPVARDSNTAPFGFDWRFTPARIGLALVLLAPRVNAAPSTADPDWPCLQRLVPQLTIGSYWGGPPAASDWRGDSGVAAAVMATVPRAVPLDAASARLHDFVANLPASNRPATVAALFAGLVDETNRQRDEIIGRLRALTRRQREITHIVARISTADPDADQATRDEVVQRRGFLVQEFEETERTIRYACEIPVQLEARLGAFGRLLDGLR